MSFVSLNKGTSVHCTLNHEEQNVPVQYLHFDKDIFCSMFCFCIWKRFRICSIHSVWNKPCWVLPLARFCKEVRTHHSHSGLVQGCLGEVVSIQSGPTRTKWLECRSEQGRRLQLDINTRRWHLSFSLSLCSSRAFYPFCNFTLYVFVPFPSLSLSPFYLFFIFLYRTVYPCPEEISQSGWTLLKDG